MTTQLSSHKSPLPSPFNPGCSSQVPGVCPPPCDPYASPSFIDFNNPATWDYGFKRVVTFLQSPPLGAGILSMAVFFLIIFSSNLVIELTSIMNLGIFVSLSTIALLGFIVIILFIL